MTAYFLLRLPLRVEGQRERVIQSRTSATAITSRMDSGIFAISTPQMKTTMTNTTIVRTAIVVCRETGSAAAFRTGSGTAKVEHVTPPGTPQSASLVRRNWYTG